MRFVPVVNHISAGVRVNYQACVKDTVTGSTYRIDPLGEAVNFYSLPVAESASEKLLPWLTSSTIDFNTERSPLVGSHCSSGV